MKQDRIYRIYEYVLKQGLCTYDELTARFDVSLTTLRRDVDFLSKSGKLEKVYGGVRRKDMLSIPHESAQLFLNRRQVERNQQLDYIGALAAEYVNDGDVIIMGSGYTVYHMLLHLKERRNLSIITNNLLVAYDALDSGLHVHLVGGDLVSGTYSTIGIRTIQEMRTMNAGKAFISCNGIAIPQGFTNVEEMEAEIKKGVIQTANQVYMLADSSKFDRISMYHFARFQDVSCIITDQKPPEEYTALFASESVELRF